MFIAKEADGFIYCSTKEYAGTALCAPVFSSAGDYIEIEIGNVDLRKYSLPEAKIRLYLDSKKENIISCILKIAYEDVKVDLLGADAGKDIYRDYRAEYQLIHALNQYF